MVSQRPLHGYQSNRFKGSHLSCARKPMTQCQPTVKLHRVFSSYRDSPGIFTWSAISPGLASRQNPHRDTIRAGRNFIEVPLDGESKTKPEGIGALTLSIARYGCFTGGRIPATSCRHEDRTVSSPFWVRGMQSLRVPFRVFPADCPHSVPFGVGDTGMFQQIATLYH